MLSDRIGAKVRGSQDAPPLSMAEKLLLAFCAAALVFVCLASYTQLDRQGSQDAKNEQHDHQLHHREAPGGAQFLFDFLYNRQHKCTSFISGRSTKIDRFSNISRFIIV